MEDVRVRVVDVDGEFTPEKMEAFKNQWRATIESGRVTPVSPTVRFLRTHSLAKLPTRGTDGAVGWDVYAVETQIILPSRVALISTGWNIAVPDGYEVQVRSRSGLALKNSVFVLNSPGTIDPDYRGSLGVILYNGDPYKQYTVEVGARIAQLVVAPVTPAAMIEVEAFDDTTARGTGGYGSTGR